MSLERFAEALRRHWIEIAWTLFAAVNVGAMVRAPSGETIPFHFIWISLSIVYGFRLWRPRHAWLALAVVILATGPALAVAVEESGAGWDELTEVPLMGCMFVAMMYHVERRQAAAAEVKRLAANERRLVEAQRDMIRDASHELRTPIAVARGHTELIREAYAGQMAGDDAEIVLEELGRLARISERLLILAASEHPDFLHLAPVDLGSIVDELKRRWSATADRNWEVHGSTSAMILADGERLEAIMDALLENAVKHTKPGDTIALSAEDSEEEVVLAVEDSGPGIDPTYIDRIFDRFSRGNGNGRRNGTGLGLAIVKAIAEAHGGTVSVRSEPNRSTRFEVRLPKMHAPAILAHA